MRLTLTNTCLRKSNKRISDFFKRLFDKSDRLSDFGGRKARFALFLIFAKMFFSQLTKIKDWKSTRPAAWGAPGSDYQR